MTTPTPTPEGSWWSRRTRNQKVAGATIAVLAAIGLATSGGGSDTTEVAGRTLDRASTETTIQQGLAAFSSTSTSTSTSATSTTTSTSTSTSTSTTTTALSKTATQSSFANCSELAAAGLSEIPRTHPRFDEALDRDGDGIGCEVGDPARETAAPESSSTPPDVALYATCDDARAAGAAPLRKGQRGYSADLDSDGDGVACEDEAPMGLMSPTPAPAPTPTPPPETQPPVTAPPETAPPAPAQGPFKNCTEARAAGAAPVYAGTPGYGPHLDRDGDGVACE